MFPTIKIKAVNVELTTELKNKITQKIGPLARLVAEPGDVTIDVVLRRMKQTWSGDQYCVSVRMSTAGKKYYAVAGEAYLSRSLIKVRDDLRRSVSRSYQTSESGFETVKKYINERFYKELLA